MSICPCVLVHIEIYCSLCLYLCKSDCMPFLRTLTCLRVHCPMRLWAYVLSCPACSRVRPSARMKKCHKQSCPHTGPIHACVGPVQQIDRNEIFCNLNVNGSEIYRWVLCNYQCHNLLDLCLCKVESKSARGGGNRERWDGGENKEKKWRSVERLSGWQSERNDDLYLVMVSQRSLKFWLNVQEQEVGKWEDSPDRSSETGGGRAGSGTAPALSVAVFSVSRKRNDGGWKIWDKGQRFGCQSWQPDREYGLDLLSGGQLVTLG